jgi:hypothetical protein
MRSHFAGALVALAVAFLIAPLGATRGFAQAPNNGVHFQLPQAAIDNYMQDHHVGEEWAYDLCRLRDANPDGQAAKGTRVQLDPSQSPCGDPLNPSATVTGGNPPYHFKLEPMGGFPPMGMWIDLNGVLRGTPKNTHAASFSVCAEDMGGHSDCQRITMQPTPAPKSGPNAALLAAGAGVAVGGALLAGSMLGDLAATTTASSTTASNRFCIVHVMSSGCECAGSVYGESGWDGPTAGGNEHCGAGIPCAGGYSCNNGVCEGRGGRCPF